MKLIFSVSTALIIAALATPALAVEPLKPPVSRTAPPINSGGNPISTGSGAIPCSILGAIVGGAAAAIDCIEPIEPPLPPPISGRSNG